MEKISELNVTSEFLEKVPRQYFEVHKEVIGVPLFTKPIKRLFREWGKGQEKNQYRIDFVMCPTEECLALGWDLGPIGVEVKKSPLIGKDFGRAVSQIMDYQTARFKIPGEGEKELSMIFLYSSSCSKGYGGTEASIMMQEGIGLIQTYKNSDSFKMVHANGNFPIFNHSTGATRYDRPRFGYRTGHR